MATTTGPEGKLGLGSGQTGKAEGILYPCAIKAPLATPGPGCNQED